MAKICNRNQLLPFITFFLINVSLLLTCDERVYFKIWGLQRYRMSGVVS